MRTHIGKIATVALASALLSQPAYPTTVVPLSLDQMVERADVVFVGEVVDRQSVWSETRDGRGIVTHVTFNVLRVLKGQLGLRTELTFQGGRIGQETEEIDGMPAFRIGDRDVLFVSPNKNAVSPLVGFWQGRFRVVRDAATGESLVRTFDGNPVMNGLGAKRPAALGDFEALVRSRVEARSRVQ